MRALLLAALAACNFNEPMVMVHFVDPQVWSSEDRYYVLQVSAAWSPLDLDFRFTDDPRRTSQRCPRDWYKTDAHDCTIDVGLFKRELVQSEGIRGRADRATDEATIDSALTRYDMLHVAAHEVGHIVLNTGRHLDPGTSGVMESGGDAWVASPADLKLACETIARACKE